ncbi:hypothetical protein FRC07_000014 [Ceratobasidium sp. 392]|nr:hypothetical protein FRC07_000014 [Ceratobasidium sp. 392]
MEPTSQLSRSAGLLLRADTLFRKEGPLKPCYYPGFVNTTFESLDGFTFDDSSPYVQETNMDQYERDLETESIVKRMLLELGMPDVTHIELQVLRDRFLCERCSDRKPKKWTKMATTWKNSHIGIIETITPAISSFATSSWFSIHILRLIAHDGAAQLKTIAEAEERKAQPYCYLRAVTGRRNLRMSSNRMLAHMQEVHGVTEPAHGVYCGNNPYEAPEDRWCKEWGAFHDARKAGAGSSASGS